MESSHSSSTDAPLLLNDVSVTNTHDLPLSQLTTSPSHPLHQTISLSTVPNSISRRPSTFITSTLHGSPETFNSPPFPVNPNTSLPQDQTSVIDQHKPTMYTVHSGHYAHPSYPTAVSHSQLPVWPAYELPSSDSLPALPFDDRSNNSKYYDNKKPMDYAPEEYFDYRSQHYHQDSMGRVIQPSPVVHVAGSPTQPPFIHRAHQTPSPIGSDSSVSSRSFSPAAHRPSSNRSNSTDSSASSGSSRSVRWNDDQLVQPDPIPHTPRPHGFWNRRGDRLWTNDGRWKPAPPGCEYPPYLKDYPEPGQGWENEHGVRISMSHRRVPEFCKPMPKSALKKTSQMGMGF